MENKSYKYACLFGGGAIRGAAYCGTVKAMAELGIKPEIIAGSSVGSIIAGLLALDFTPGEIKEIFLQVNFELFKDLQFALGPQFAISKGEVFLEWIRDLIEKKYYGDKYKKGSHKAVTFADIQKNLVIITTDLSSFECKEFSKQETPDFEIAAAIRISCSMPGLMKPVEYNNRVLVDGDLQKGSPMWRLSKNLQPEDMRILEFRLEGDFEGNDKNTIEYINSIYSYATSIATGFIMELYNKNDKYDYIVINTGDINIVDFNLPTEKRENMIEIGYTQTMNYFKDTIKKKKKILLAMYEEITGSLKKIKHNLEKNNIQKSKTILSELFMYICDYTDIIDDKDFRLLKKFKEIFLENLEYPALFGKTTLKNSQLIKAMTEQIIIKFSEKIEEYKTYLNTTTLV